MTTEEKIAALQGMNGAAQTVGASLDALGVAVGRFTQTLLDVVFWQYIHEGAVYGKTYKGFHRWLKTQQETS